MSLSRNPLFYILCLSFPVWGLILAFASLSLFPNGSQTPGELIVVAGMLAPVIGAVPIFRMSKPGPGAKTLIFIAYYAACSVTMLVVGWASLGVFGLAK